MIQASIARVTGSQPRFAKIFERRSFEGCVASAVKIDRLGALAWLRSAVIPVLAALAVAALGQIGMFQLTNGLLFDLFVSGASAGPPRVVVVRASLREIPLVVSRARAAGARSLVIGAVAAEADVAPPATISGVPPIRVPGRPDWTLPGSPRRGKAAAFIPPPEQGITRRLRLWLPAESGRLPTIEGAVLGGRARYPERLVGLSPRALMPSLAARQIISGAIPAEVLRGLWVVVGPPRTEDPARFLVSGMAGSVTVGAVDYHARALQSGLSGHAIQTLRSAPRLLLMTLFALVLWVILAAVPARFRIIVIAGAVVVIVSIGVLLIYAGGVMLPVTELLLLAMGLGLASSYLDVNRRQQRLASLGDRAASYLSRNLLLQDQRRWIDYFPAAARLTGVESSLLLEQRGDETLSLLAAFGPRSKDGVSNLRRSDVFDQADAACPEPIAARDVPGWDGAWLTRVNGGDVDPIYWLHDAPGSDESDAIFAAARRLAARINQYPSAKRMIVGSSRKEMEDVRLTGLVTAVISRAGDLRRSLRALHTAAMLFDAAGLPIQVNNAMEALLRRCGLQPARVTPVDVAARLSGLDPDAARLLLGDLVRNGGDVRLSSQGEVGGRRYTVRATEADGDLIFEAIDVTDLYRLAHIQSELAGQIDAKIRNDLEAIELASRLATDARLPEERRSRALVMISQASARTRQTLNSLGHLVEASIYENQADAYPMNPRSAVLRALADLGRTADHEGVKIQISQQALSSLVLAEPDLLDAVVHAMLHIVVRDSPRGATASAVVHEGPDYGEVVISGGFGMAADRFAAHLSGNLPGTPQPFRTIRRAQQVVESWGGSLEATSEVGQGFRFALRLKRT
jgi:signal transduction histidine kinase